MSSSKFTKWVKRFDHTGALRPASAGASGECDDGNFSFGKALGQGADPQALLNDRLTVAEGAFTAPVLVELARKHDVAMPIAEAVGRLLEGAPARAVAGELLARPLTAEGSA